MGGHLATPTNIYQMAFVAANSYSISQQFWLGIKSTSMQDKSFHWDGIQPEILTYSNWDSISPRGNSGNNKDRDRDIPYFDLLSTRGQRDGTTSVRDRLTDGSFLLVYLRKENALVLIGAMLRLLENFSSDNGEIIHVMILTRTFMKANHNIRMFVLHHMNLLVPRHIQMITIVRLDGYLIKIAVTYGQVKRGHIKLLSQLARDTRIHYQN